MKSDEDKLMQDAYLVGRLAKTYPWMNKVYKITSGYIHFSKAHIQEAIRIDETGCGKMVIGSNDFGRTQKDFLESMQCMLHLNKIINAA